MSLASDRSGSALPRARLRAKSAPPPYYGRLAVMPPHKHVLGLIDPRGEVRRPAMVWVQLLHKLAMGPRDLPRSRAFLETQNFISLIFGNRRLAPTRTRAAASAPRVVLALSCSTPSGKAAVEICL